MLNFHFLFLLFFFVSLLLFLKGLKGQGYVAARCGGVHFSPCGTSQPIGCWSKARFGDRKAGRKLALPDQRCPGRPPDEQQVVGCCFKRRVSWRACAIRTEIGPGAGYILAPLSATASSNRSRAPVGDASTSGNFRTCLETWTKESNAHASWSECLLLTHSGTNFIA